MSKSIAAQLNEMLHDVGDEEFAAIEIDTSDYKYKDDGGKERYEETSDIPIEYKVYDMDTGLRFMAWSENWVFLTVCSDRSLPVIRKFRRHPPEP